MYLYVDRTAVLYMYMYMCMYSTSTSRLLYIVLLMQRYSATMTGIVQYVRTSTVADGLRRFK